MSEVERQLRTVLHTTGCADEAIWRLAQEQVGQVLLSRAVATVFNLTLAQARQAVSDAVKRQGIPPLEQERPGEPGWPDREAGVLHTLEQRSPLGRRQTPPDAAYRACFLPSWDLPLLITVERAQDAVLKVLATEPFSGPDAQGRVSVPRWPVPVRVDTELRSWSAQALIPEGALQPLEQRAEALLRVTGGEGFGVGLDGTTILASIERGNHLMHFRTWSPTPREAPEQHAFLSALVALTLKLCPQGDGGFLSMTGAQHRDRLMTCHLAVHSRRQLFYPDVPVVVPRKYRHKIALVAESETWNAVTITLVVRDRPPSEDETFPPRIAALAQAIQALAESSGAAVEWVSTAVGQVPTEASGQCHQCGAWTTDVMSPAREDRHRFHFSPGTFLEGRLLCDLCLPEGHPLHF